MATSQREKTEAAAVSSPPPAGPREESFEELMQQLCAGSEEAAWTIADRYSPHILRVVRSSLPREIRSKVDSIDLLNTLWGSLLIKRTYLSHIREPAQLVALLTKAARNRVIEEHRKYTACKSRDIRLEVGRFVERQDSRDGFGVGATASRSACGREDSPSQVAIVREKWNNLVATLSKRDRRVLSLRIKGHTYEEIADAIDGVSARTARRVLAHIIEKLLE